MSPSSITPGRSDVGRAEPELPPKLKRGKPPTLPRRAMPAPATTERCRNCVITALNGQGFPAGTTTATAYEPDNTRAYTLTATPSDARCPCKWSNELWIEYVAVATGHATRLKRKNMQMPQVLELIKMDLHDPNNPYVTITGCTITIRISDLNRDLRAGINTQNVFFKGVVTRLELGVSCNQTYRTIVINITDP